MSLYQEYVCTKQDVAHSTQGGGGGGGVIVPLPPLMIYRNYESLSTHLIT